MQVGLELRIPPFPRDIDMTVFRVVVQSANYFAKRAQVQSWNDALHVLQKEGVSRVNYRVKWYYEYESLYVCLHSF
jgi:hypothetical protein